MSKTVLGGIKKSDGVDVVTIQPGGGFCIGLEQFWGRIRRRGLRILRPGYVNRMEAKRQGECVDCTHDIIDPRDLKFHRNGCGYWFRQEDDPFRWRDELGIARTGLAEVVFSTFVAILALVGLSIAALWTGHFVFWLVEILVAFVWYQSVHFFRDPARVLPEDVDVLISPSDGVVTDIHEVEDEDFPNGRAFRISIYLSPWDVHLNRNPCDARIVSVRYFPGAFLNARHKDCAVRNEQLWVDFEDTDGRQIRVKQISGAMARRLVCWLKPSDEVYAGERYGMIKYGSRSDILMSTSHSKELAVAVGDRVYAGETIILRWAI